MTSASLRPRPPRSRPLSILLAATAVLAGASLATAAPEPADLVPPALVGSPSAESPLVLQPSLSARTSKKLKPAAALKPIAARTEPASSVAAATALPGEALAEPSLAPPTSKPTAKPKSAKRAKTKSARAKPAPDPKPVAATASAAPSSPAEPPKSAEASAAPVAPIAAAASAPVPAPPARPAAPSPAPPSEAQQYCSSIAAAAVDAQAAWQATRLIELDQQLKQRIAELEAKRAEYKDWLTRREEALRKAEDGLVAIYSRMRPDAAALQLSAMEDGTAAAVLIKLNSRSASAILNEMEAGRAARLTGAIAGFAAKDRDGKKS